MLIGSKGLSRALQRAGEEGDQRTFYGTGGDTEFCSSYFTFTLLTVLHLISGQQLSPAANTLLVPLS